MVSKVSIFDIWKDHMLVDPLFEKAARYCVHKNKVSVAILAGYLNVDITCGKKIISQLEKYHIVFNYAGSYLSCMPASILEKCLDRFSLVFDRVIDEDISVIKTDENQKSVFNETSKRFDGASKKKSKVLSDPPKSLKTNQVLDDIEYIEPDDLLPAEYKVNEKRSNIEDKRKSYVKNKPVVRKANSFAVSQKIDTPSITEIYPWLGDVSKITDVELRNAANEVIAAHKRWSWSVSHQTWDTALTEYKRDLDSAIRKFKALKARSTESKHANSKPIEIGGGTNADFSVCADCGCILPKGRVLCDDCLSARLSEYEKNHESSNNEMMLDDGVCNECGCTLPEGQFICNDCIDDYKGYVFLVGNICEITDPAIKEAARNVVRAGYHLDWAIHNKSEDVRFLREQVSEAYCSYKQIAGIKDDAVEDIWAKYPMLI